MPFCVNADSFVDLHCPEVLTALPVPEPELAICISRGQELPIRREGETTCITRIQVTREFLLTIHLEVAFAIIDYDFVIHALASKILAIGVHCRIGDGLHVWFADVFCHDRDSKLPQVNLLVICCGHEPTAILNEGNCVNAAKVFFILLYYLAGIRIILKNLLVCASCQEYILLVIGGMEAYTEWGFAIGKATDDFACLSIPELNDLVKSS